MADKMLGPGTIGPGPHGSALWVIAQIRDIVGDHKCGLDELPDVVGAVVKERDEAAELHGQEVLRNIMLRLDRDDTVWRSRRLVSRLVRAVHRAARKAKRTEADTAARAEIIASATEAVIHRIMTDMFIAGPGERLDASHFMGLGLFDTPPLFSSTQHTGDQEAYLNTPICPACGGSGHGDDAADSRYTAEHDEAIAALGHAKTEAQKARAEFHNILSMAFTLKAENERLRKVVEFYADGENWTTKGHPQIDANDTVMNYDRGKKARAALEGE